MTAKQMMLPANRAFNSDGAPEAGAMAFLYLTGTTTPALFYEDVGLTVPLGSSLTANAAGRFTPMPYQDNATAFRLVIEDANGTVLDDIDPFFFGFQQGVTGPQGASGPAGDMAKTTNRTALAAITGQTSGATRFLVESGREGTFVWSSVNNSTNVTADTQQGIYVASASDPTGASGAWVRKFSGPFDIRWFGAVADCTAVGVGTDAAPAINGAGSIGLALNKSCSIYIPGGAFGYRVASNLKFTSGVTLKGDGYHENPGQVGVTTYTAPSGLRGSMLVFDQNVAGLQFIDFTDNAANAQAFEFESSRLSVVQDLRLFGGGGTTVTAHGLESRTLIEVRNVTIQGFAGNGLLVDASVSGTNSYGNASLSKFDHIHFVANGCHGAQLKGTDANVVKFDTCRFSLNGGAGVLDQTTVGGNNYIGCQFATNNQSFGAGTAQTTQVQADSPLLAASISNGSIIADNTSATTHVFVGIYIEGGNGSKAHLPQGCIVIGGLLAEIGSLIAGSVPQNFNSGASIITNDTYKTYSGFFVINDSNISLSKVASTAIISLSPGAGAFSQIQLTGNTGLLSSGLDILAGGAHSYLSSDGFTFRNAAQTITALELSTASAAFNGSITASNLSGTNTGDQFASVATGTIIGRSAAGSGPASALATLPVAVMPAYTGDVTSSAGAVALTIAANAVTFSKMQALSAGGKLLGSAVGNTAVAEITVGTGLTVGTSTLRFANISATTLLGNSTAGATTPGEITLAGGLAFSGTTLTAAGALTPTSLASTGAVTSSSATAGIGYATGAGGTVTQLTSRTTGVTLNKICGAITLVSAAGSATWNTFTVTNSAVAATDTVEICQKSGANLYNVIATAIGAGTFNVSVSAVSGTATESPIFNFVITKAVAA